MIAELCNLGGWGLLIEDPNPPSVLLMRSKRRGWSKRVRNQRLLCCLKITSPSMPEETRHLQCHHYVSREQPVCITPALGINIIYGSTRCAPITPRWVKYQSREQPVCIGNPCPCVGYSFPVRPVGRTSRMFHISHSPTVIGAE